MTWWLLGRGDEDSTEAANGRNIAPKAKRLIDERRKLSFRPTADTVVAMGKGKNRCYVIPSLEMVVIRMGDSEGREFSDNEFLGKLLGAYSAKSMPVTQARTEGVGSAILLKLSIVTRACS